MVISISPRLEKWFKGYCSYPSVILMFVYFKLRYSLSYRDLEEMMRIRGSFVDHSTLGRLVVKLSKLIENQIRRYKVPVSKSWRMDETYIKLNGKWVYLYRAVDKFGSTIDFLLRRKRNVAAAKAFFKRAIRNNGTPEKVTIDKSGSNKAAMVFLNKNQPKNEQIEFRQIKYLNNIVEQDHRFIKKRIKPMLGFKNFYAAQRTIAGIESIRMIQKGQIKGCDKNLSTFHNFTNLMEKGS
jgi:putative transposase